MQTRGFQGSGSIRTPNDLELTDNPRAVVIAFGKKQSYFKKYTGRGRLGRFYVSCKGNSAWKQAPLVTQRGLPRSLTKGDLNFMAQGS